MPGSDPGHGAGRPQRDGAPDRHPPPAPPGRERLRQATGEPPAGQQAGTGQTTVAQTTVAGQARRQPLTTALGVLSLCAALALLVYGTVIAIGERGPAGDGSAAPGTERPLASFDLPAGWEDRSGELAHEVMGPRPERVYLGPSSGGFRSNLNIVRQPAGGGTPPLDELVTIVRARVKAELGAELAGEPRRLELDGVPAAAYDYHYRSEGRQLMGRQVVTMRGDSVVFINFTAERRAFGRHVEALDTMIGSWRWR